MNAQSTPKTITSESRLRMLDEQEKKAKAYARRMLVTISANDGPGETQFAEMINACYDDPAMFLGVCGREEIRKNVEHFLRRQYLITAPPRHTTVSTGTIVEQPYRAPTAAASNVAPITSAGRDAMLHTAKMRREAIFNEVYLGGQPIGDVNWYQLKGIHASGKRDMLLSEKLLAYASSVPNGMTIREVVPADHLESIVKAVEAEMQE